MTYIYKSPILGEYSEDFYNTFIKLRSQNYDVFIKNMRSQLKHGALRSGILVAETKFRDVNVSGEQIYKYLVDFGFTDEVSSNVTRLFSVNNRLMSSLINKGLDEEYVIYDMDIKARLKALWLKSATVTESYALESKFYVPKISKVKEEPQYTLVEPVEEEEEKEKLYRSQATFTYSSENNTKIEMRIWFISKNKISEQELIGKWNEANDTAVNLTNEPLIDQLEGVGGDITPGFELNHELLQTEIEGSTDIWYGKLIISRSDRNYVYEVL